VSRWRLGRGPRAAAVVASPSTDDDPSQLERELAELATREREAESALLSERRKRLAAEERARSLEQRRGEAALALQDAADNLAAAADDLARADTSASWRATREAVRLRHVLGAANGSSLPRLDRVRDRLGELETQLRSPPRRVDQPAVEASPATPSPPPLWRPPPVPKVVAGRLLDVGEDEARKRFLRHYSLLMGLTGATPDVTEPSFLDPVDLSRVLAPSHRASAPGDSLTVDVVVCVHDALAEVRACLWSLLAKTSYPFHLILVDDGSGSETRRFLEDFVARHPLAALVSNAEPPHGYTIAANLGLSVSGGDVVVLLNSDTKVTYGWLDGLLSCFRDDPACGLAGPLSNAATHQSIPHKRERGGGWARNELPPWMTGDVMSLLLRDGSQPARPNVSFLNGFCFAVRREVIDAVGDFDADLFGPGYCEENDYCVRASDAGFKLVVADNSYVEHARGTSYGEEARKVLRRRHYGRFLEKHGEARLRPQIEAMDDDGPLDAVRRRIGEAVESPDATRAAFRAARPNPLSLGFVLPHMASGGSGGQHSVYQETCGLRELGVDAVIFASAAFMPFARAAYQDAAELFIPYDDPSEIVRLSRGRDILIATHFQSVQIVAEIWQRRQDFLPAYYCQDYEPFFGVNVNGGMGSLVEARESYEAIPGMTLFAKTHWIGNAIGRIHGVPVAKVEPSIDETLFTAEGRTGPGDPVGVTAMVRPRTWRRQPFTTLTMLDKLKSDLGAKVKVRSFGCPDDALSKMLSGEDHGVDHLGVLTREQVAEVMKDSDVFLDVSVFQGMGRGAFEGMACGCVPVLTKIGGTHEFAVDGENAVLVDPDDPVAAYGALRDLVLDRPRLARLQAAAATSASRRSVLAAVLSEYAMLEHAYMQRVPPERPPRGAGSRFDHRARARLRWDRPARRFAR
jgi:O-antigen biosynthesis protein